MARWKANPDGSAYYDPNDTGPNQVTPPAGQFGAPGPNAPATSPSNPWSSPGGPTKYPGWLNAWGTLPTPTGSRYPLNPPLGGPPGVDWNQPIPNVFPVTAPPPTPQGGYQPMEGVDMGKMNDPTHTSPKYIASRILASGGSLQAAAAAIGATPLDATRMRLASGEVIDTRRDEEGANALQWLVMGGGGSQGAPSNGDGGSWRVGMPSGTNTQRMDSTMGGSPMGGSPGFGGLSLGGASTAGLAFGDRSNSLWNTLLQRSAQGLNINPNDPIIANQVSAFGAQQERAGRNYLAELAESEGPNANLGGEQRLVAERAGQATGALQAQLVGNELMARRQEIQNALTQMGGMLSDEQRMALQLKLGLIDANLRQQQVTNQNTQFGADLGLRAEDRASYWDSVRQGLP